MRQGILGYMKIGGVVGAASLLLIAGNGCQSMRTAPVGSIYDQLSGLPSDGRQDFEGDQAQEWMADQPERWQVLAGRYHAQTRDDEATVSLYATTEFTNAFIEVDYIRSVTSVGSGGLVVRASDEFRGWEAGSAYMFALGSDGEQWQFAVYRQMKGKLEFLKEWTPHGAFQRMTNRLAVLAQDDVLQFYANEELIWEGRDRNLHHGHFGLFGSTSKGEETTHHFDHVAWRVVTNDFRPVDRKKRDPDDPMVASVRQPGRSSKDQDKSPVLKPGFLIRMTVLASGKREIDAQVIRVSDNNLLDLPLIGPVPVKGMTLAELNATLQGRYQDFFIEPQVLAEFVVEDRPDAISPWGSVVVLGRVRMPGRVNIPPTQDLTVSGAIQQAGGLDTSARSSAIRLTRRKPDGSTEKKVVDMTSIGQGSIENDLILQPGDVIFVPEKVF